MADRDQLTPRQQRALTALLCGQNVRDVARAQKVGETTLHRWLHEDTTFQAVYRAQARVIVDDAAARIRTATQQAVDTVTALLNDDSPAIRLRAAALILDCAHKYDLDDVQRRLDALEM